MSTANVISLDAHKAQNEARWLRMKKIGNDIVNPAMELFIACNKRDQEMVGKCLRELRAVAVRELGLSEVSNQVTKGSTP